MRLLVLFSNYSQYLVVSRNSAKGTNNLLKQKYDLPQGTESISKRVLKFFYHPFGFESVFLRPNKVVNKVKKTS